MIKYFSYKKLLIKIFKFVFLGNIFEVTFDLCLTTIAATKVKLNNGELLFLITYTVQVLLVLFVPCWFASQATTKVTNFLDY